MTLALILGLVTSSSGAFAQVPSSTPSADTLFGGEKLNYAQLGVKIVGPFATEGTFAEFIGLQVDLDKFASAVRDNVSDKMDVPHLKQLVDLNMLKKHPECWMIKDLSCNKIVEAGLVLSGSPGGGSPLVFVLTGDGQTTPNAGYAKAKGGISLGLRDHYEVGFKLGAYAKVVLCSDYLKKVLGGAVTKGADLIGQGSLGKLDKLMADPQTDIKISGGAPAQSTLETSPVDSSGDLERDPLGKYKHNTVAGVGLLKVAVAADSFFVQALDHGYTTFSGNLALSTYELDNKAKLDARLLYFYHRNDLAGAALFLGPTFSTFQSLSETNIGSEIGFRFGDPRGLHGHRSPVYKTLDKFGPPLTVDLGTSVSWGIPLRLKNVPYTDSPDTSPPQRVQLRPFARLNLLKYQAQGISLTGTAQGWYIGWNLAGSAVSERWAGNFDLTLAIPLGKSDDNNKFTIEISAGNDPASGFSNSAGTTYSVGFESKF